MATPDKKRDTGCPIAFALDTFGDRWSLMIIRDIALRGSRTYGEFRDTPEKIATNVLADRLRELEADGIIQKTRDPENQRKNIYALTEKGCDLIPVVLEMVRWSAKYDRNTKVGDKFLNKIKRDRDGFEMEIRSRLKDR